MCIISEVGLYDVETPWWSTVFIGSASFQIFQANTNETFFPVMFFKLILNMGGFNLKVDYMLAYNATVKWRYKRLCSGVMLWYLGIS